MFALCLATAALLAGVLPAASLAAQMPSPLVYTLNGAVLFADGTGAPPRKLGLGRSPALAPHAHSVVWVAHGEDPNKARLLVLDLASGQTSELAKPGGYLLSPQYAPDGKTLVFVRRSEAGVSELWSAAPGRPATQLAVAGGADGDNFFEPTIAPTDGTIVYQDMQYLFRLSPSTKNIVKLPLSVFSGGRRGVFNSSDRFAVRPGTGEIVFSMPVEGTRLFQKKVPDLSSALFLYDPAVKLTKRLTPEEFTAFGPAWTPDGATVVFTGYTDKQAGGVFPFRLWSLTPGQTPKELGPGEDPMPPAGGAAPGAAGKP